MNATLWHRVDQLIDSAPGLADFRAHGLHLLAARLWRSRLRPIPAALVTDELHAVFTMHAARIVLEEIRSACEGPVLVMKGPVAAEYPHPALRPYHDVDILVAAATAAQAALIRAGFDPPRDLTRYRNVRHHLAPLRSPSVPLLVEVHSDRNGSTGSTLRHPTI